MVPREIDIFWVDESVSIVSYMASGPAPEATNALEPVSGTISVLT
jgi:hypothetical protein